LIRADGKVYLLKRRARGKDDAYKVAFCHSIQLHLAAKQFPLPHLIGTRKDNNSLLQWKDTIYELFEFIKGTGYDQSLEATQDSGKTLGLFHKLLEDFESDYDPPKGSYHASRMVRSAIEQMPAALANARSRNDEEVALIEELTEYAHTAYNAAAQRTEDSGMAEWPAQIIHSDWHPGNMLFRGNRVVAVIDYDAARLQQRVIDSANGALQFSIIGGGDDPTTWPEYLDLSRYKRFLMGYDSVSQLAKAELDVLPWLMIQALIAEAAVPIGQTGMFARMDGLAFLQMVRRKVDWMQANAQKLSGTLDD